MYVDIRVLAARGTERNLMTLKILCNSLHIVGRLVIFMSIKCFKVFGPKFRFNYKSGSFKKESTLLNCTRVTQCRMWA